MAPPTTLSELLAVGDASSPALCGAGASPLTYRDLRAVLHRAAAALAARGLGAGDRVALVLPNGPAAATAFLAVASHWTACPLNPAYTVEEFRFALTDLDARAVLVPADAPAAAIAAAAADCDVPLVPVHDTPGRASVIRIAAAGKTHATAAPPAPGPDTESLALHTSGTTARPKLVLLRHRNLVASAGNIARTLHLGPGDRCLSPMPLFHVHGLVAAVLSSLSAGGSVWCAPPFDALRFFGWMAEAGATWITAVPSMYQAILLRADRNADTVAAHPFRLLRSSSAALAAPVYDRLREVFAAPVLESYGMTEAAQQICATPPPPGTAKSGSVGPAAGPEVAILDDDGNRVSDGDIGEVAIRGDNVHAGYAANEAANAAAFTADGWFRTGDRGRLDRDGFLFLEGRIKEIINRGGEKLSPGEIENALLAHPRVREAVAFAVPHRTLGEDVGAAVVADGVEAAELKFFAAERLAAFKVPRTLLFVDELPKGPTGKVARVGLAARLGLDDA